jgi:hypothetical protein
VLVDVLLVVGDDGLGDRLADGVDLRGVTTTGNANADVDIGCGGMLALTCSVCACWGRQGMVEQVRNFGDDCATLSLCWVCVQNLSRPRMRTGS